MLFPPLSIDLDFSQAIQQFQPSWLTSVMRAMTNFIDPTPLFIFGLLIVVYLYFKKYVRRTILVIFLMTLGNLLTPILKNIFDRPRPSPDLVHVLVRETDYSFPSGHAIAAVILGGIVAVLIQRFAKYHQRLWLSGVALLILLVGFSRIYLGAHWLTDVLAGYAVGCLWVISVVLFTRRWYRRHSSS